jgi:hypothetical protein
MESYVTRGGTLVKVDEAFLAWTSGDLSRMLRALHLRTNPIDRHFLLMAIVKETYSKREDPSGRRTCLEVGLRHVEEFESIAPSLRVEMGGFLPRVTTFAHVATVLAEDGRLDEAVSVCEKAVQYGLRDGTKGGYPGRIARIRKQASTPRGAAS